jgi:hypothetical protein
MLDFGVVVPGGHGRERPRSDRRRAWRGHDLVVANGGAARRASTGRYWWLALAALVPVGVSLVALGLRARRPASPGSVEAGGQARAAARAAGVCMPVPPARRPSLFI